MREPWGEAKERQIVREREKGPTAGERAFQASCPLGDPPCTAHIYLSEPGSMSCRVTRKLSPFFLFRLILHLWLLEGTLN